MVCFFRKSLAGIVLVIGMFSLQAQAQDAGILVKRGQQKMATKDYKGAVQDFTEALELLPEEVNLYVNRSLAKQQLKNYAGAEEDLGFAIEIDSANAELFF